MRPARRYLADGDLVSGGVLAALGIYIVMTARQWAFTTPDGPGPGFFPAIYGALLVLLSLALLVSRLRHDSTGGAPVDWLGVARAMGTWVAFVASIALMGLLGFTISFALLAWFLASVVFGKSPLVGLVTALGSALGFYLVFVLALDVALPSGILGF